MLEFHDYGPPTKMRVMVGGGHMLNLEEPKLTADGEPGISQSTGLTDNGEFEIFGGDVLARPYAAADEFEYGVVVYFQGSFWVDYYSDASFEELLYNELLYDSKCDARVVGNRWQTRGELEAKAREVFGE